MFKPLPFYIGLRYTAAKRRNHFISFISLISMLGLTLGIAVLITVLSVMNGFDHELQKRILGMVPHAVIRSQGPMTDWRQVAKIASQDPDVVGTAPFTQVQGMVTERGQVRGILLNGILPSMEPKVSIIQNHMIAGSLNDLKPGKFGIIVGQLLARYLDLSIGDKVTVILPEASLTPAGVLPRLKRFTVVGIFKVGAELDANYTVINIDDAERILHTDGVGGVRLKVDNLFKAPMIAERIAQKLPGMHYISDWTQTQGNLFRAIGMEKTMIGLLLMFIVAVAAFNIVSALVMVVTDKRADIAILRTMGATPGTILRIFIVQGAVIGLTGLVVGAILGIILALNVSDMFNWLEHVTHHQFLSADVYFISYLPSQLKWSDVAVICGSGLAMSLLATLYPAWRASKVDPAEALRYE